MEFKFEKLVVWQKAIEQSNEIHLMTKKFPSDELYGLSSQIKRAADSVALNIAEGSAGQSNKQFLKFLSYAYRSAIEVVACLHICLRRDYISQTEFSNFRSKQIEITKMLSGLKKSIRNRK